MHGRKNDVEIRLRKNKASYLLDLDSDTCHVVNNCIKKFAWYFQNYLKNVFGDIYYDLKSTVKGEKFFEVCLALSLKKLKLLKRPDQGGCLF